LSLLLVHDQPEQARLLQEALESLGHRVLALCPSGQQACGLRSRLQPDLALIKDRLGDMDGLAAAREMQRRGVLPVVVLLEPGRNGVCLNQAEGVYGYLPASPGPELLGPALELVWQRFQRVRSLEGQVAGLRQTLAERKAIERAKGIVMEQLGLGETEARARLEQEAQRQGLSLVQMAEGVITTRSLKEAQPK
jgi:response regulator NasT